MVSTASLMKDAARMVLIILHLRSIQAADLYDSQPRILTQDGHLTLLSGQNRNITLRTSGRGCVNINGENLLQVTRMAKTASESVERTQRNVLSNLERRLQDLGDVVNGPQGIIRRVEAVEVSLRRVNGTTGTGSTGGSSYMFRLRLNSVTRRANRLNIQVRRLVQRLARNECTSNPCQNGGTCEDAYNMFFCRCTSGWEGEQCEVDVNECERFAGTDLGCQNGATCTNNPGSYLCSCMQGWFGIHCTEKLDTCAGTSSSELCGHGICVNQRTAGRAHTCICDQGWSADLVTGACTVDVDECNSNYPSCSKNPLVMCVNVPGSFHCGSCPPGYVGNGYYCSDMDECQMSNGGCSLNPRVQCINTPGSRICGDCPPGYQGNGVMCTFGGGTCQVNNGGCHTLATCTNAGATVLCTCPAGYVGPGVGQFGCVLSSSPGVAVRGPCDSNPCLHGSCYVSADRPTVFFCTCLQGFTGPTCDTEINPCSSSPCKNGATCFRSELSYMCRCTGNFTGRNCDQERQSCGGYLRQDQGILQFPSSGSTRYSRNMDCSWVIIVNNTKVVSLNFTSFNLERTSAACIYDWFQIHDGRGAGEHIIGRFCGNTLPNNGSIVSTHNALYMWFHSDHSINSEGFALNWNAVDPVCGGHILVRSHGVIQSPGSPGKYPHNRDCYWYLTSYQTGRRIQFAFVTLMIESHPNCSYDYLEISSGWRTNDQILAKYCNTSHPPPLVTIGPHAYVHFHSDEYGNDAGFQIAYHLVEGIPGCGGTVNNPSGTISSPTHPDSGVYDDNLDCEWKIQLPLGDRVRLTFLSFSLEDSASCRFDYVEVRDGGSIDSPLVGRYCGSAVPSVISSTSNTILVYFHADFSVGAEGFRIKYETLCGSVYTELSGILRSPFYPSNYPENRLCLYEIALPLGNAINLNFLDFDVESLSYPRCFFDYVAIYDGDTVNSTQIGKYCGEDNEHVPPPVQSTHNYLTIVFRTDGSVSNKGFKANYSAVDVLCGGILKTRTGVIETPQHPEEYPPNTECHWVISAQPGWVIQLTFNLFSLEGSWSWSGANCPFDWVELFENGSTTNTGTSLGKFCGNTLPPAITTQSNVMTIKFRSDSSNQVEGFSASYVTLEAKNLCGGLYRSPVGVMTSPNYPDPYPQNVDCVWNLQVPPGQQISLSVIDFQLESYPFCTIRMLFFLRRRRRSCDCSFLEIRNGGSSTSPLIGRYCGTTIPRKMTSFSNQLYVHFNVEFARRSKGFKILWDGATTGCGAEIAGGSGSIISPNYPEPYHENAECFWKISGSRGSVIHIMFIDIDMEQSESCDYDYVEIRDGFDSSGKLVGRYCRAADRPVSIVSTTNHVYLKFRSDFSNSGRGFHMQYNTVCNLVVKGYRGVIESPNFPQNYPPYSNCLWNITATQGNKIDMSFSHFELEGRSCRYDYLEIKEGQGSDPPTQNVGKFCGNDLPQPIASTLSTTYVHFVSDMSDQYSGFRIEWVLNGCGGHFQHPDETFASPNYPHHYNLSTTCEWTLTVEIGKSVQLTVYDFSMEKIHDCSYDSLTVFGGPDDTSPQLGKLCATQNPPIIFTSSGNNMFVRFVSDASYTGRGFQASYRTVNGVCGGIMKSPTGQIHSRNYPDNYGNNDDCEWYIEVYKNHVIKLTFIDFSMETHHNCIYDYLKVFDGNSTDSPVLLTHCGNTVPTPSVVKSTGNRMFLRMKSDGSGTAKGFIANYTISCGARIIASDDDYGVLSMSDSVYMNEESENCSWIIIGTNTVDRISLTINYIDHAHGSYYEGCSYYYVEVRDGDDKDAPLIGKYCNTRTPPTITSQGSALFVQSVHRHEMSFSATYSLLSTACGGNLSAEQGSLASPGYPNNYPASAECVWTIISSPGNRVQLGFRVFDLESSCSEDYLEIRENDGLGPMIGMYCGNTIPSNLTASHKLWIKFRSSEFGSAPGFIADYNLIHGNNLNGSSGQIASPLYPRPFIHSADYSWLITVDFGMAVSLTFQSFYIPSMTSSTCDDTDLKIYDGFDETAPVIRTLCGEQIPDPVTSSSNIVYIKFVSSGSWQGSWFLLSWLQVERQSGSTTSTSPPGCGGSVAFPHDLNFTSYNITSPGYPQPYENNLDCEWIVEAPPSYHLTLKFNQLNVENYMNCMMDYVQVFKGENGNPEWVSLGTYCLSNATLQAPLVSTSLMKVVFHSDYSRSDAGFSATVNLECGGLLSGPSGSINAYNLSGLGLHKHPWELYDCEWIVTVRTGRTIAVTFDLLDIQASGTNLCTEGYVILRNGASSESPFLSNGKYCGTTLPTVNQTTGNELYVKYVAVGTKLGFKLRYQEVSMTCGGRVILSSDNKFTEITSPRYPQIPHPFTECEWVVMAPSGQKLRIDFTGNFDVECRTELLELYDGGTRYARKIGQYCANHPNSQLTTDNALYIHYLTNTTLPHNGFKANISMAVCGGTLRGRRGFVASPSYPGSYANNLDCEWKIVAPPDYYLLITFEDFDIDFTYNCSGDSVSLHQIFPFNSSGSELGKWCGSDKPAQIQTSGNEVEVMFHSDSTSSLYSENVRFKISYTVRRENCGGVMNTPSGIITSPNYPYSISTNIYCSTIITVPKGRRISAEFLDFDLGENALSTRVVFYLNSRYRTLLKIFDPRSIPRPFESPSNTMTVYYRTRSASTVGHRGFKLSYTSDKPALCGGDLIGSSEVITFPPTAFNFTAYVCEWERVQSDPRNETLAINFVGVAFGVNSDTSSHSHVTLLKGDEEFYKLDRNITAPTYILSPFTSTKIQAVKFRTSGQISFTMRYSSHMCGGILSGPEDTITSPNYPSNYPADTHCAWSVNYPDGQGIQIHFRSFVMEPDCRNDYVLIFTGPSPTSPQMGPYCGNSVPNNITVLSSRLFIEFHSNSQVQAQGFKIMLEPIFGGCGGLQHDINREIATPNFPRAYTNNAECVWEMNYKPGYTVQLNFVERFFIEESPNCGNDFVEAFDNVNGNWVSLGKACGPVAPRPFKSNSNRMKVIFRSNNAVVYDGFKARWSTSCGAVIAYSTEGIIVTPGYPDKYTGNLNCNYTFLFPDKYVEITFLTFSLEQGFRRCNYDNVTILVPQYFWSQSRMRTLGTYCGNTAPPMVTENNRVEVIFQTDRTVNAQGFMLKYEVEKCGGNVTAPQIIKIWNSKYTETDRNCTWIVTAPDGKSVTVRFSKFQLKLHKMCVHDWVETFDDKLINPDKKMGRYCGNLTSSLPVIRSTGRYLTLQLVTFGSSINEGVIGTISFTNVCGGTFNITRQPTTIRYPHSGVYDTFEDCIWTLTAPVGQVVEVTMTTMNIAQCSNTSISSTCDCDYVELRDGSNQFADVIGRYCGTSLPRATSSSSNRLWIRFASDGEDSQSGFVLQARSIPSICGTSRLNVTDSLQQLTSPNFPANYPINIRCSWLLTADAHLPYWSAGPSIHISFLDLDLETGGVQCTNDRLEVKDLQDSDLISEGLGENLIFSGRYRYPQSVYRGSDSAAASGTYCGSGHPHDYYSNSNDVRVTFYSNSQITAKGFKLQYSKAACNRNYTGVQGRIKLKSRYSNDYAPCTIFIQAQPNHTISVYFYEFGVQSSSNCSSSYLQVRDGIADDSPVLATVCGYQEPPSIFSNTSAIKLYLKHAQIYSMYHLDVTYTTTDQGPGCGGPIFNYAGSFTSPLYPNSYRKASQCRWDIMVPARLVPVLRFPTFDIGSSRTCETDYIEFYDVDSETKVESFRTRYCGGDNPAVFEGTTTHVAVRYTTSIHNGGTGWVIIFIARSPGTSVRNF